MTGLWTCTGSRHAPRNDGEESAGDVPFTNNRPMQRLLAIGLMLGSLASSAPDALPQSFHPCNPYGQLYNN